MVSDTNEVDVDDSISTICPNFVHTLDSSLLILTVCDFMIRGGSSITVNHDSFGTHACNVSLLKLTLLHTRIDIFTKNRPMKNIIEFNKDLAENKQLIPEVPADGDFNLAEELPKAVFADS